MISEERINLFLESKGLCRVLSAECEFASCRYHIEEERYLNDRPRFPEKCVLDLADRDGMTLEEVGLRLGITRERVRQIEMISLHKIRLMTRLREKFGVAMVEECL